MFRTAVIERGMSYDRFREDFINAHTFHADPDPGIRNDHLVNLGRIGSLLQAREDLVRRYSTHEADKEAFLSCMREHMLQGVRAKSRSINFECFFSDQVLSILADAANDIPLFKNRVTKHDMNKLFNECSGVTGGSLVANQNTVVAYFFSQLNYFGLITAKYQHVISNNRLIMCSRGKTYMTQRDLSSALSRFGSVDRPAKIRIDRWVLLIKSSTKK